MKTGVASFTRALVVAALLLPVAVRAATLTTGNDFFDDIAQRASRVVPIGVSLPVAISFEGLIRVEPGGDLVLRQGLPPGNAVQQAGGDIRLARLGVGGVSPLTADGMAAELPIALMPQVPEPSSWKLLLAGAVLLGGVARRRFRNRS